MKLPLLPLLPFLAAFILGGVPSALAQQPIDCNHQGCTGLVQSTPTPPALSAELELKYVEHEPRAPAQVITVDDPDPADESDAPVEGVRAPSCRFASPQLQDAADRGDIPPLCDTRPAEPALPSPAQPAPPRPPNPATVAARAFTTLPLPAPDEYRISPPVESITQFPTEITLTGQATHTHSAAVSVPGVTLSIRATPETYRYAFGDGRDPTVTQKTHVTHTYTTWGCYEIRIEGSWRGEWSLDGVAWNRIGTPANNVLTRASVTRSVTQIVGVLIDRNHPEAPEGRAPTGAVCATRDRFPLQHDPWAIAPF